VYMCTIMLVFVFDLSSTFKRKRDFCLSEPGWLKMMFYRSIYLWVTKLHCLWLNKFHCVCVYLCTYIRIAHFLNNLFISCRASWLFL
jgi:hypothetical protein